MALCEWSIFPSLPLIVVTIPPNCSQCVVPKITITQCFEMNVKEMLWEYIYPPFKLLFCCRYGSGYSHAYGSEGYHHYMRAHDPSYEAFYNEGPSVDERWRSTYPYVPTSYSQQCKKYTTIVQNISRNLLVIWAENRNKLNIIERCC